MKRNRYDTLRLQLIRLCQTIEQHEQLKNRTNIKLLSDTSEKDADPIWTDKVLQRLHGDRQHVRISDRLPLLYTESPEVGRQSVSEASPTSKTLVFSDWVNEIARQKDRRLPPSSSTEMLIHLQSFEGELIYFVAFRPVGQAGEGTAPPREISISGSGMSLPTELSHVGGEDLFVVYFPPTDPFPPLQIAVQVVRDSTPHPSGGYQTPLKFMEISVQDQKRIVRHISVRQQHKKLIKAYDIST